MFATRPVSEREELPGVKGTSFCHGVCMAQFPFCLRQIYGRLRRKPAKSPGAENPPKKTCRKFAKKKNTKQERGPRWPTWGPCDMDTNGAGVVFNRKIRFAT